MLEGLARHDCSAALAWCAENRVRLRKLKSNLEFKLRVQVQYHLLSKHMVASVSLPLAVLPSCYHKMSFNAMLNIYCLDAGPFLVGLRIHLEPQSPWGVWL